jgi:hypothetical protein
MTSRWIAIASLFLAGLASAGRGADPLYLQAPFDEVLLDENNGNARLKVQPLTLPARRMPAEADRKGDLEIELVDRPGEKFQVSWTFIVGIRFFEQMVLAEAEQLVQSGRFDEAYPYYRFLEANYPRMQGLKESLESYLWTNLAAEFKADRYEQANALAVELFARNPQYQGLAAAMERITAKLVEARLVAKDFRAARRLLAGLVQRFPQTKGTTAAAIEAQLEERAVALVAEARRDLAAGKRRDAWQTAVRALEIWPAVAGGRELAESIHREQPVVIVAATAPASRGRPQGEFAQTRVQRLLTTPLVEPLLDGDKTIYRSAIAEIVRGDDPRRVLLRSKPDAGLAARGITPHDLARWLMSAADPAEPAFDGLWGQAATAVTVQDVGALQIEFRLPAPRPEALLLLPLPELAPYAIDWPSPKEAVFTRNRHSSMATAQMPALIVERTFDDSASALRALRLGEASLVDRVSPWDLSRAKALPDVAVEAYAWPTVHLLVPDQRSPLAASRTLRRAILLAIDRQSILHRALLDGRSIAGCQVISGPFPRGLTADDPHGYAYDARVEPRPYDPALAAALLQLAIKETSSAEATLPLVLTHPPEPIARVACQSIARQLEAVGFAVSLRQQEALRPEERADLHYVELSMHEPLADAWRLFGPAGLAGQCSAALRSALREVLAAGDWPQATARLQQVHRLAAAELPVLPLWQTVDHFACHASVRGVGPRPISLYQNVEQWQVELRLPSE